MREVCSDPPRDCPGQPITTEVDDPLLLSIDPDFRIEVSRGLLSLPLEPA